MRSRIRNRAVTLVAAGATLAGIALANAPAGNAADGGSCKTQDGALFACVNDSFGHWVNADAYFGYAPESVPPDCTMEITLVDAASNTGVATSWQRCSPGHHVGPSVFEWSGTYWTYVADYPGGADGGTVAAGSPDVSV
jgi:hypothetical protein